MKTATRASVFSMILILSGCGGGVEEGVPKDLTPGVPPEIMKADMSSTKPGKPPATSAAEPKN